MATTQDILTNIVNNNNSAYQAAADKANKFTHQERVYAQNFNAKEAQKNREWQENMSSTAHQREVADLQAAGLNPILSVNNGANTSSGATASITSGSGQKADIDTSLVDALTSLATTSMYNSAALTSSLISSEATRYASDMSASALNNSAYMSYLSSLVGAKQSDTNNRRDNATANRNITYGLLGDIISSGTSRANNEDTNNTNYSSSALNMFGNVMSALGAATLYGIYNKYKPK